MPKLNFYSDAVVRVTRAATTARIAEIAPPIFHPMSKPPIF